MNTDKRAIQFRLDRIEELTYSISGNSAYLIKQDNLGVQFLVQTFLNKEANLVKLKVGAKYNLAETTILNLELLFVFNIDNMERFVNIDTENKQLKFNADLIPTFINVAIGGMRGVLFEKTKGTVFAKYPLPLVDLQELIKHNTFHVEMS